MKKTTIKFIVAVCCITFCSLVSAYGGIRGTAASMSSGRLMSDYSFVININIPHELSFKMDSKLSGGSSDVIYQDFDATKIPVHELPPLPLSLDTPEEG